MRRRMPVPEKTSSGNKISGVVSFIPSPAFSSFLSLSLQRFQLTINNYRITNITHYGMYFLFLNLGAGEIMIIALFVLMFFGSKQIPELMRGFGRAAREFKDAMNGIERDVRSSVNVDLMAEEKKKPAQPAPPPGVQQTAASQASSTDAKEEKNPAD
jgi:sec-independent protein translocase protein TatA